MDTESYRIESTVKKGTSLIGTVKTDQFDASISSNIPSISLSLHDVVKNARIKIIRLNNRTAGFAGNCVLLKCIYKV